MRDIDVLTHEVLQRLPSSAQEDPDWPALYDAVSEGDRQLVFTLASSLGARVNADMGFWQALQSLDELLV